MDLKEISYVGLRVDETGRLVDGAGHRLQALRSNGTRVPFTEDDDQMLMEWASRAELQGIKTTNFEIFEDLERVNPRHTKLSWHFRWSRKLQNTDRLEVSHRSVTRPVKPKVVSSTDIHIQEIMKANESTKSSTEPLPLATIQEHSFPSTQNPPGSPIRSGNAETFPSTKSTVHSLEELGPSRRGPDNSITAPQHFRPLQTQLFVGAGLGAPPAHSEPALRTALGVNDRSELKTWLLQDWVIDAYSEYASSVLDALDANDVDDDKTEQNDVDDLSTEQELSSPPLRSQRLSSQKFLANRAVDVITTGSGRYLSHALQKDAWTNDDFAIRFIVQIVTNGSQVGRWWEWQAKEGDYELLCLIAYRLLFWIRHIHRIVRPFSLAPAWQKAMGIYWKSTLANGRFQHRNDNTNSTRLNNPTTASNPETEAVIDASSIVVLPGSEEPSKLAENPSKQRLTIRTHGTHHDDFDPRSVPDGYDNRSQTSSDSGQSFYSVASGSRDATTNNNISLPNQSGPAPGEAWEYPNMPNYPVKVSRLVPNQIKGLEWLSAWGRQRFEMQQDRLLGIWGVRRSHIITCVQVPRKWANLEPLDLFHTFDLRLCPPADDARLTFALADHSTSWVRALTWFTGSSKPRRGVELDVFLDSGPYVPMEGSHLCHHGHCIIHAVYEDAIENGTRRRCLYAAEAFRGAGMPVPRHCTMHKPPCLMQLSALTIEETYAVQLWVLAQAKGLVCEPPPRPPKHPYTTFEARLPLSYAIDATALDPSTLVDRPAPPASSALHQPVFYCLFCSHRASFRKVIGYWAHIRDKHGLVSVDRRLEEIKRTAGIWRAHFEFMRELGHGPSPSDPTLIKLQQVDADNFTWEVVVGWKLSSIRERPRDVWDTEPEMVL